MIDIRITDLKAFREDKNMSDDYEIVESVLLDLIKSGEYSEKPLSWRKLTYDLTNQIAELQDGVLRPEQMFYVGALVDRAMNVYKQKLNEC